MTHTVEPDTLARTTPAPKKQLRRDIQGLRAIAVVLVILNHLVGWPNGGFVGVDLFFAISGYLITSMLLREHARSGRISFKGFYVRRVKRILPAALSISIVTVVIGFFLFPLPRAMSILADGLWASVFSVNWRLIVLGTDYMHANDALSPLQHYWSLSVEEQFYLFWPIILVGVLTVARRSPRRSLMLVLSAITAASFVWSMWQSAASPTSAYFSTLDRVWELGAGALLAFAAPSLARALGALRPAAYWVGLALIGGSVVLISEETIFPAPWALLPIAGAACVIVAGAAPTGPSFLPLTNPISVYVGEISFSLYLWHLPVIVFISTLLPQRGEKYVVLSAALILLLSVMSYHWIESPLRHAQWSFRRTVPRAPWRRKRLAALAGILVAVTVLSFAAVYWRLPATTVAESAVNLDPIMTHRSTGPAQQERDSAIAGALSSTAWPELTPAVSALGVVPTDVVSTVDG